MDLKELDDAARANLSRVGLQRYEERKQQLLASSRNDRDIEETLRGFIWDESEAESSETSD